MSYPYFLSKTIIIIPTEMFDKILKKKVEFEPNYPVLPLSVRPSVHGSSYQLERHLAAVSGRLLPVNRLY